MRSPHTWPISRCTRLWSPIPIVGYSCITAERWLQESVSRLDADTIVYGTLDSLLAAQVPFRRLYGNMAQQKLYLLQLSSRCMAEPRTRAPKVVWRQFGNSCFAREFLHDMPNGLLR